MAVFRKIRRIRKIRSRSETALRNAVRIAQRTRVKLLEAEATGDLGASARARGDDVGALKWLTRALVLYEDMGLQREAAELRRKLL